VKDTKSLTKVIKKESKIEKEALAVAIKELAELQRLQKAAVRVSQVQVQVTPRFVANTCLDRGKSAYRARCDHGCAPKDRASVPCGPSKV
jgi:hypothetical protein